MRIGIIGAGRVGCSIALGLYKRGFEISGIFSKSKESAAFLNSLLGLKLPYELYSVIDKSDVIFITVPDMELNISVNKIIETGVKNLTDKIFLHCSGSETSDVLKPLKDMGASVGSLHPIQTFADKLEGYKGLNNIYFGFEGDERANAACGQIVQSLEANLVIISKEAKTLYHAAACVLSNYVVTLSHEAENMLEKAGIDKVIALKAFEPLLRHTVENISDLGSLKALTGPVSRGDIQTVHNHLDEIQQKMPESLELYKILLKHTAVTALEGGKIDSKKAALIKQLGE